MKDDTTRRLIYGTIAAFLVFITLWLGFIYINACGFTLNCVRGAPLVVRTPIPTLIPVKESRQQPAEAAAAFDKCQVGATGLIGAWIAGGHSESEPFPFTDRNGKDCQGTFADVQPLFVENSLWFPGSLGCSSCHNADLTDRSAGLDLSSFQAVSLGTRRVAGSTSPGTDIFGDGDLEKSLLYQVLTGQGLTPQGHSPDVEPVDPVLYAGQVVEAEGGTATPAATATP